MIELRHSLLFNKETNTNTNSNATKSLSGLLVIIIGELQTLEGGDAIPPMGARDTFG